LQQAFLGMAAATLLLVAMASDAFVTAGPLAFPLVCTHWCCVMFHPACFFLLQSQQGSATICGAEARASIDCAPISAWVKDLGARGLDLVELGSKSGPNIFGLRHFAHFLGCSYHSSNLDPLQAI